MVSSTQWTILYSCCVHKGSDWYSSCLVSVVGAGRLTTGIDVCDTGRAVLVDVDVFR